ncbi:hypothetical protein [Burkholderia arboris]|uniref:hypothetical protein n=1 Tax=Burkholderia arboris TaxID=488730 RepID=UPI001CF1F360|nr:hypothetical protein [Burkholderia arboris]MCA8050913.1 hypothetical protein [Burkholderia arboris]CAJ6612340.1 Uncharacterised protein [Burkholderia pseudomallei]CAJ6695270.1 Uncharacterised protein [Burkholderia pseudomallei]
MEPIKAAQLGLLPVTLEIEWERGPIERRARQIHAKDDLPDWKLPETCRGLERILDAAIASGKDPRQAVAHLDAEILRIFT